ncbi:hypothetical protein Megpolyxen_01403 [Candidatus Megaera polyxenophila]|nr:hypothetical protein Megpolyxen_01403 [Candidatus Megaera polyxenophila]
MKSIGNDLLQYERKNPLKNKVDLDLSQYERRPQEEVTSEPSVGQRIASGAKAITAGVAGAIPDTLSLAYNLPAMAQNAQVAAGNYQANPYAFDFAPAEEMTYPVPLIPSATEAIDQGIDTATGGYTTTPEDQKYINEGLKTGASFLTGGGLAKTAQGGVAKLGSMIGNTDKWQAAGAAAMGGTTSYLADQGASTSEALGGGLAANLAVNTTPTVVKGGKGLLTKGALSAVGLGKKQLNLEAAKAGQSLDITLPKAAVSEGKAIALADQFLSKTPVAGDLMQQRHIAMGNKVLKELEKAYDSALPKAELAGVEDRIKQLYSNAGELLPKEAQIVPKNVTSVTESIKAELTKSASLSAGEKRVLSIITDYEDKFVPMGIKRIPSPVEDLVASQDSLGKVINWDDTSINWRQEKKASAMVKKLYNAISNDLEEYGRTNPDWYNYQKEADKLFTKLSRRKELESMLGSAKNSATEELSYNSLSKILNDEQNRARLQKITSPEIFERLDKLSKVARAMAIKNKNMPNPSGTAATQQTFNFLSFLTGYGAAKDRVKTGLILTLGTGTAHLLTDKKTLDLAIKFAETPTNINAVNFSKSMKQITGYTPVTLLREAQKLEQGKEEKASTKNNDSLLQKFNNHIEENKKRPPAQALKKILNNPYVKKGGEFLEYNPWFESPKEE